jgi:FkbM family methyltransferase
MKVVQIGSNKGDDDLSKHLKKNYDELEFGLFVEANPLHIGNLKNCYSQYSNAIIENIAIKVPSYQEDTLKLYYHQNDGPMYHVASCVKSHLEIYYPTDGIKYFEIPCITIDDLFKKYEIISLDWLLLDIEGIDVDILLSTDWSKYNIQKIEYEHLHLGNKKNQIENIFKDLGYKPTSSLHHYDTAIEKKL